MTVDQKRLNNSRMDEWDEQGLYREVLRLKLTSKHALVVGRWCLEGSWGVDLRRWSYDLSRLLAEGITLNSSTWEWLMNEIGAQERKGLLSPPYPSSANLPRLRASIDGDFVVATDDFHSDTGHSYLCVNLLDRHGNQVWKGRGTRIGIMIRFDTVRDLIISCREKGVLPPSQHEDENEPQIDARTGRKIF